MGISWERDRVANYSGGLAMFEKVKAMGGNMKLTTFFGQGHGTNHLFIPFQSETGLFMDVNIPEFKTEFSSDKVDPEPMLLKWLFSKNLQDRNSTSMHSQKLDL